MTAHDYEDLLQVNALNHYHAYLTLPMQCAIPVFDSLLPEPHNTRVLKLLFDLAHWHALAKLHMHTDTTVDILSNVAKSLSNSLHEFEEKTCSLFETWELE